MKKGLLVVLLIFLSIWPAIWNGYPILYMDSGWYIGDAFWGYTPRNYALAYPYFIRAAAMIYPSLWMVVLLQAALMVYTLFQLLDALGFARQFSKKFLISSLLFLFTPLSWVVSHIMPDVFTAILACGAAVMLLSPLERSINRLFLFCLTVYACACHDSHIVLIAATIMALIIISFIRRSSAASLKCLILPAACLCFAALLVFGLNFKRTGNFYLGQSGSVYLANRLIEDGILQKLLSEQCEKEYYALCPYQDKLPQERGAFLWEPETSPLYKIGGWEKSDKLLAHMIIDSIKLYPIEHLFFVFQHTRDQLLSFHITNFIFQFSGDDPLIGQIQDFYPQEVRKFFSSRQQKGELQSEFLAALHTVVAFVMFFFLLYKLGRLRGIEMGKKISLFSNYILTLVLLNAFISGIFSHVEDRYQSRLIWLLALAALVIRNNKDEGNGNFSLISSNY